MKQDQNPETPNVCNNCVKPEKKPVDEISILIKCDAATQKVIEEICINQGVSFSQYFLALHGLNLIDLKMEGEKTDKAFLKATWFYRNAVAEAKNIAYSKEEVNLPDGFGELNLPEDAKFAEPTTFVSPATIYPKSGEHIQTSVSVEPPKKRGRPFKIVDK